MELQDHGIPEEKQVLPRLVKLAREMDIPLVITNDCHYLTADDAEAQEVLMCIQTGKTLSDPGRMKMTTRQLYVKSEEEMRALFPNFPDAIENTAKIAARCNVEFDFSTTHLPKFPLPGGETDALAYLRGLCEKGFKERYSAGREDARKRMEYELGVISGMGYVDYFLIVWDFIHYARTHGVGVGPGRGSGAGSIVAYCLGITAIDPIQYNLLFERFLNPERVSMPDIDDYGIIALNYEQSGGAGLVVVPTWITSGNFVNVRNYRLIAGFREELFIDSVDHELCHQFYCIGKKVAYIADIPMQHALGNMSYVSLFGRKLSLTNHSPLRYYYRFRNNYVLYREDKAFYRGLYRADRHQLIKIMLFEKNRREKWRMIRRGIRDAKRGVLGKYAP